MIEKDIDRINESDLQLLKDDRVPEGKTIEYKQSLPSNTREDKKKFLSGISSFANAIGGDYIIGIVEDRGIPQKIEGVEINDPDEEILRLEQIIRNGISPRIPSVIIKAIELANEKISFVIRIPQSWIRPHRIIFSGYDKFYSRNSAGKYQLDVDELRMAFNLTETIKDNIKNFRLDRISNIFSNEHAVPFVESAKIVLHFIPLDSLGGPKDYELNKYFSRNKYPEKIFRFANNIAWRFNIDGFLTYREPHDGKSNMYVQVFRNGIIEYVHRISGNEIYSMAFQNEIIEFTSRYLSLLKTINVGLPIFIFMTLLEVKDFPLIVEEKYKIFPTDKEDKIDKNIFIFPEIAIEDYEVDKPRILRPWFDLLWNACGYERCFHYDDNGNYNPKKK